MITLVATIHVIACLLLIFFVLLQDAKGGTLGTFGGGGSQSVLGATGAQTFFAKLTTGAAIVFAGTSIWLTILTAQPTKSATDAYVPPAAPQQSEPIKVDGTQPPAETAPTDKTDK